MSVDSATPSALTFSVTTLFAKQQENAIKAVLRDAIIALAERYSFDADEAIHWLEVVKPLTTEEKKMQRKAKADSDSSSTDSKKKTIPLPWIGLYNGECCQGIAYNYGLFTQCQKKKADGSAYCKTCDKAAKETENDEPPCGTIAKRVACSDWSKYTDSKDRKPTSYGKVLHRLKIEMSDAIAFAAEKGFTIPDCYLEEYVPAESKGRPKKSDKEVSTGEVFDSLVENSSTSTSSSKGRKLSPEERLAREEKRKAEKAEKEQAAAVKKQHETTAKALAAIGRDVESIMSEGVPQEIAEAAVKKHIETMEKKAELAKKREEEKAIKKAAADEKKAEEKAKKAAEKEIEKANKLAATKAAAEAKKGAKKPVVAQADVTPEAVAPQPKSLKVCRINAAGEKVNKEDPTGIYFKDGENTVYDLNKVKIGFWSEEEKKIIFTEEEEEEFETM